MSQYFEVHPENPQPRLLAQAAKLLRERYGYRGELRATGEVLLATGRAPYLLFADGAIERVGGGATARRHDRAWRHGARVGRVGEG